MKTGKTFFSAALCATVLLAAEARAQSPDLDFDGATYQCRIFRSGIGDSGFTDLKFGGKTLIRGNRVYGDCKGSESETLELVEQPDAEYKWENNVLTNERFLIPRKLQGGDAEKIAKICRRIAFEKDKITIEITVTALRDITFPNVRRKIREVVGIVTDSVRGMRIEGVRFDDQVISSLIPVRYERRKWSFTTYFRRLAITDSEKLNMHVSAAAGSRLYLNHYGGTRIELEIFPEIGIADLRRKAGTEIRIGYTIEFRKTE